MKKVMPAGPVFQAGTLSGNPVAMAAGLATLQELRDHSPYQRLDQLAQRLADGLTKAAREAGVSHTLNRIGSMWTLFFTSSPVANYDDAKKSDTAKYAKFFWAMMDRGFYLPCSQFEAAFNSVQHGEAEIDATIAAVREALAGLR